MWTKKMFTVLGTIMAISPVTVFQKKTFKLLYQCYVATWTVFIIATQVYVYILRKNFLLPQKIVFVIVSLCELFLDFSITISLCKHSNVLLKLLNFLTHTWTSKCMMIWMLVTVFQALSVFFTVYKLWFAVVGVYSFLRFNSALMGLTMIFHLTKSKVRQFNQKVSKSSVLELKNLLHVQKNLFSLLDCLNWLFGPVIFWAVLTAICLALDYVCLMIYNSHYKNQNVSAIGYYTEVIYFELHVCALITSANQLAEEMEKTVHKCYDRSLQGPEGDFTLSIAHQAHVKQPRLNASGFFEVDNSTFVFGICAILNYTIVICQTIIL